MKKIFYFLLSFVLMFSCQVDGLDQSNETLNAVYAKSKKKEFQYICHKLNIGNDWKFITLYLPPEAIQAHLDHGDAMGECPNSVLDEDGIYTGDNTGQDSNCDCTGNVTRLDLRYNGAQDALIRVTGTKGRKPIYKANLSPGELFKFHGFDRDNTLGAEIHISVNGERQITIDTSCSEANILGFTYGDFTIEGGSSLNGGEFCPGVVM
jgi:hypothetical protein